MLTVKAGESKVSLTDKPSYECLFYFEPRTLSWTHITGQAMGIAADGSAALKIAEEITRKFRPVDSSNKLFWFLSSDKIEGYGGYSGVFTFTVSRKQISTTTVVEAPIKGSTTLSWGSSSRWFYLMVGETYLTVTTDQTGK